MLFEDRPLNFVQIQFECDLYQIAKPSNKCVTFLQICNILVIVMPLLDVEVCACGHMAWKCLTLRNITYITAI